MSTATPVDQNQQNEFEDARQLFCVECGYGIVMRRDPPECPMCRSVTWGQRPGSGQWN
jgi:rubrerythrin